MAVNGGNQFLLWILTSAKSMHVSTENLPLGITEQLVSSLTRLDLTKKGKMLFLNM